ncbi:MAG: S-layer homology domain-containing protein [Peptococcaceae bacterium]|nr:S-layer homology domain-containing protein [Peptococcaceae bacterium]
MVESSKISGSFSTTAQGYAVIVATAIEDNQDTSAWHGIIFQGSNGKVYGDISLAQDLSTPEGSTLEIEQGTTLRIEKDAALTNSTTLVNKGTIQVDGLLINSGTVRNEGSIEYSGTIQNDGLFYSAENGVTSDNGTFTGNSIKDLSDLGLLLNKKYLLKEENGARYYSEDGGTSWTAYTGTISFWGGSSEGCIEVQSGTHDIILNNVTAGNGKAACIDTGANSRSNTRVTLVGNNTINGCIYVRNGTTFEITEESTGQLDIIANGTNYNPPIGAGFREQPGVINIHGGTVTVEVLKSYGLEGAIGPGQWGSANAISIKNSTVVVKGTAGTGGPSSLCGSRITMENANVIVADKVKGTVDAINSLVKTEGSKLTAYDYTLMEDMTVEKDTTLTIPEGKMLTIPEGVTLTLEEGATLENNGTIICYGTIDGDVSGEVRYASQVDVNIAGLTDGKAAYGSTITVTATMTKKPATTNSLSAEVGKVDFYLGDTTGQPLASADVNDNHGNYTATMKLTLDDETWAKGFRMGENTIIADFGGIAGSADKEGLATSTGRATLTVVQGEQEAPAKPEKEDVASDSVVLKTLETSSQGTVVEYGYKTASEQEVSHWQTVKAAFEGLLPGTTYTFYARYKGNDYYKPSNISEGTEITTLPIITTSSLAAGKVGIEYNKGQLSVTSQEPVEWTISDGTLPEGLSLDKSTGEISGTPTKTGTYHFTVQATIKDDISASQTMSIEIEPGTPAFTGVTVKNGDDVSNAFTYGDTITVSGKIITDSTTKRRNTLKTNQVGLYLNADDAPLATANVGADGSFELRYTIADQDKLLPKEGKQTLMLKYSGSDNLTEGTTTVEITVGKAKQDPPVKGDGYSIDFKNEIIAASESYELATSDQATTGEQSLTVTPGANVFVRLAESKTHYASDWTEVDIPARPPAPKNVVGSVNTLSGLSTDMEYSRDGKSWAEVKGTSMELTAGDYYVRYKAMTDNFASESVKVTVKPYSGKYSYETTVTQPEHGKITVDKYVTEGENVTITVTPDKGYEVDKVTVTDKNGKTVDVTKNADGTYSFTMPKSNVTITATLVESDEPAPEPQPSALPFTDVSADAWYIDPVRFVYSEGLMTGTSATTFSPNLTTTRGMIVAILYRMEGEPDLSGENLGYPFADVDASAYYGDAVYWARMNGIVSGYSSDAFGPTDSITREQLAAILYNYAEYKGVDVSARNDLSDNTDAGSISGWATDAMQWANAAGIVSGMSATELAPKGNATRAQVAAMLQRYITNVIN